MKRPNVRKTSTSKLCNIPDRSKWFVEFEKARLYRRVMEKHLYPYGLKAKHLLKHEGYEVEDHCLKTREETNLFKVEHGVKTTPQIFIDGQRVGGYDDTRHFLDKKFKDKDATS